MSLADWQIQLSQALVLPNSPPWDELSSLQGLESHRLALYQELMFNTVLETLESIYPFTHQLISEGGQTDGVWQDLAETYRRAHPNPSYKLLSAVAEFPRFLAGQPSWMGRFPFISELAQYEWLEMQVLNMPATNPALSLAGAIPELCDFAKYAPLWNVARVLQHFEFPVPDIIAALQAQPDDAFSVTVTPQAVDVLIYRDPHHLEARFFCLNGMTSLLLQCSFAQPDWSYTQVLAQLQATTPVLQNLPSEGIMVQAAQLFQNCLSIGLLLGSGALSAPAS
jgi:hypothetical protein